MPELSGTHHVKFAVADMARSISWYERVFGFKTTMTLLPDDRMYEYVCTENQKFRDYRPN